MSKIVIIGAGAMGSAFALPCLDNNHDINIVGTHLENDFIDEFKKNDNLHPGLKSKIPKEIIKRWENIQNNNLKYENTTDLIPLFKKTDIMLADTTSAIQEYLLQKKPVVTFRHNVKRNYLVQIEDVEDIESALNKALEYPTYLLDNINKFTMELHPYQDGQSSARVMDACIDLLTKDTSYMRDKPWNLIRKYKIRKRLGIFTLKSYNRPFKPKM